MSPTEPGAAGERGARLLLAALVTALFVFLLWLRVTGFGALDQTALFYVGLPALLAVLVVLFARPRSAVGIALAVLTVALLLAGPLLGEGMVCLVIAAPLLYGVTALVAWFLVRVTGSGDDRSSHVLVVLPLLVLLTAEGIGGFSLLPREGRGEGGRVVAAGPEHVAAALAEPPEYDEPEALFLRSVPFPTPVEAAGEGLEPGDTRHVTFTDRRVLRPCAEPEPRHMELEVAESHTHAYGGRVVFTVTDDTAFDRWMRMHGAEVVWERSATGGTRLDWTLEYERTFEPSWYFGPVQAYAADRAAAYLADTFAEAALGRAALEQAQGER
ncbi:hypothetical protein IDM40_16635 [Nocardiopsis sp. HNM0947]|uniref:Polyketide cyclase / dehydrase and lipid transport n=1 Tax=Nocardiopsis coralli TaxID=2772213 RepID=A0ABR9P8Z7_9ACTN|nr:hypothetical protein [Nocardiopsis coralli]MBE3000315.1 hypothetical protein [Nocardiopsis coralli]